MTVAVTGQDNSATASAAPVEEFPATPVEEIPAGEPAAIDRMINTLKEQLEEKYLKRGAQAMRDAHPKTTGLVRARFIVDPKCPSHLRFGILGSHDTEFTALVRFSNGFPTVRSDLIPDVRGMAIKLPDVRSELADRGKDGQDFLLATAEAFFGRSAVDFADFVPIAESKWKAGIYFLRRGRLRGGFRLLQSMTTPASPLALNYFSQTPYLLGPHVVKYSARPTRPRSSRHDPWYLRPVLRTISSWLAMLVPIVSRWFPDTFLFRSLKSDLERVPVEFDFFVQVWPDLATLPTWAIEDPTRVWPFPWTKVATIVLPQQSDLEAGLTGAEPMTFHPWHALKEHQPLGGINRARGRIYKTMSAFRHRRFPRALACDRRSPNVDGSR